MANIRITNTPIGQLFQWDYLTDVELDVLESSIIACRAVLENPERYPNADLEQTQNKFTVIDEFLRTYGEQLVELV